jgi:DNA-binding CsgD family transcriptional regulator
MLYCSAIGTCLEVLEIGRMHEWAADLGAWLMPLTGTSGAYLGNCHLYLAHDRLLRGSWTDARSEVASVCADLEGRYGDLVHGHAHYLLAEILRLCGEAAAEDEYRRAGELGASTQPGLALLRLAQGEVDKAVSGIRRALSETTGRSQRIALLAAAVPILAAGDDLVYARAAAEELADISSVFDCPAAQAQAAAARAVLLLAEGEAKGALPLLRRAVSTWRELGAPYEVARLSVLIARACRAMGDEDGAVVELDAARSTFLRLGAHPDLVEVGRLVTRGRNDGTLGLTAREVEVLRLVAAGRTNRAIATELHLSERTVHRHVSNIFVKLGVTSRAAAATYAVRHRVVDGGIL